MWSRAPLALLSLIFSIYSLQASATVSSVAPTSLSTPYVVDFEEYWLITGVPGAPQEVNEDGIVTSGQINFAERFAGQSVDATSGFDVISGAPTDPLTLATGLPNLNLTVANDQFNHAISGEAIAGELGEGSIAVLFDADQSQLGFDVLGADAGDLFLSFFARDGSLLADMTIALAAIPFQSLAFATDDTAFSIAGFTVSNNDPEGVGLDNFVYNAQTTLVPVPPALLLFSSALLAMRVARRG